MKSLRYIAFAAALLASGSAAQAKMDVIGQVGAWRVSAGTNNEGNPMCSMSTFGDNGRSAYIKWQSNSSTSLFVHLYKNGWNIPPGIEMPLTVQFDSAMTFTGIAKKLTVRTNAIEAAIRSGVGARGVDEAVSFLKHFVSSSAMSFKFPGGSEPDWHAPMAGSKPIGRRFTKCIVDFDRARKGGSTQPFGNNGTTQPFDRGGGMLPFDSKKSPDKSTPPKSNLEGTI